MHPRSDVNADGVVDVKDVALVAEHFGEKKTREPPPSNLMLPSGITFKIIQDALDLLKHRG